MQPVQNSGAYTRRQALQDLLRAENKNDDAVANLTMIVDSLQKDESLQDATTGFIDLLDVFGSDNTPGAQGAYRQIDGRVKGGESRHEATASYLSLLKAENKNEDASGNFARVDRAVDKQRDRTESTENFNSILHKLGNNDTPNARTAFGKVVESLREGESITTATGTFNAQVDAENKLEDAMTNYNIVDQSLGRDETREQATGNFLDLLKDIGKDNTPAAQSAYRDIDARVKNGGDRSELTQSYLGNLHVVGRDHADQARSSFRLVADSVREGETLNGDLSEFERLVRAENKLEDCESGYRVIDSSLKSDENRAEATSSYLEILKAIGRDDTPNVQTTYRQIDGRVKKGESRTDATQAFLSGFSQENKLEDATSNFNVISGAVDRGIDREESTRQFNAMLKEIGNDDTPNVASHFRMVLDSLKEGEHLGDAVALHRQILKAENKLEDVASGYRLVDSVVSEKVSRADATEYYLSLLKEYGRDDTPSAQKAFRDTHKIILG